LDRTLWDWEANSHVALQILYDRYKLADSGFSLSEFEQFYTVHNNMVWERYRDGNLDKDNLRYWRFELALKDIGINDLDLAHTISGAYMDESPRGSILMPHAKEVLDYLSDKYKLHILSNGFREIQFTKMKASGLSGYFDKVITSESCGYLKPDKRIFHYAVSCVNARKKEVLMVGDDPQADIIGAADYGIDHVYYNTEGAKLTHPATYEITSLLQLKDFL
jgi:putative hydrolase of the HAD superfamily